MSILPVPEATTDGLEAARSRVTEVTDEIMRLFFERQDLMRDIAESKKGSSNAALPIFLPQREHDLRARFRKQAKAKGIDSHFADMLLTMLMSAGKSQQKGILARTTILDTQRPSDSVLKQNLLNLTAAVAKSYDHYGEYATGSMLEVMREANIIRDLVQDRCQSGTAVNLGSANGVRVTEVLDSAFARVIGYDLSPAMIAYAQEKYPHHEFHVHDLSDSIPLPNASVAFVLANWGAASEIYSDIMWNEIARVLIPGGIAYLSFYNKDALVTKWWTPWSSDYTLVINPHNGTIMVPLRDEENHRVNIFWINGISFFADEIATSAQTAGLSVVRIESSSPLWDDKPAEFFKHPDAVALAERYEAAHSGVSPFIGQYIRLVVTKS